MSDVATLRGTICNENQKRENYNLNIDSLQEFQFNQLDLYKRIGLCFSSMPYVNCRRTKYSTFCQLIECWNKTSMSQRTQRQSPLLLKEDLEIKRYLCGGDIRSLVFWLLTSFYVISCYCYPSPQAVGIVNWNKEFVTVMLDIEVMSTLFLKDVSMFLHAK